MPELLLPEVKNSKLDSFLKVFFVWWTFKEEEWVGEIILEAEGFNLKEPGFKGIRSSFEDVPGNRVKEVVCQLQDHTEESELSEVEETIKRQTTNTLWSVSVEPQESL